MRQPEEQYRILFETMALGVVYQNAQGEIISANPAAETILGITLDQMQDRTSLDPRWKTIHPDGSDFPSDVHPAMIALKTGRPIQNVIYGSISSSRTSVPLDSGKRYPSIQARRPYTHTRYIPHFLILPNSNRQRANCTNSMKFYKLFWIISR
jgi:hypothetical protein